MGSCGSDADSVEGVCTDNGSGEGAIEVRRETGQGPPERISPTLMAGTGRKEG